MEPLWSLVKSKQIKPEKIVLVFRYKRMFFKPEKGSFKKRQKKSKFSNWLVHGFCQKIELFIISVFWAKQAREDRVVIFWRNKNAF